MGNRQKINNNICRPLFSELFSLQPLQAFKSRRTATNLGGYRRNRERQRAQRRHLQRLQPASKDLLESPDTTLTKLLSKWPLNWMRSSRRFLSRRTSWGLW